MKAEKLTIQLGKTIEKLEQSTHIFESPESQNEFDASKRDVLALLNDMVELCRDDAEKEREEDDE